MIKRKTLLILSFFVAISLIFIIFFSTVRYKSYVTIVGKTFLVEVSDTNRLLEKGLSGHLPLDDHEGMFFVFKTPSNYGIWMKDMLFPIDIIWIDENFKILHIEKSVSPDTYPKIFYPDAEALYVLEISAGQADLLKIKIGDPVKVAEKWL